MRTTATPKPPLRIPSFAPHSSLFAKTIAVRTKRMPGLDPPEHTECEAVPRHASPFASRDRRAPSRDRPATASALPCIVAVTAQKRADEPTGLTLQQRVPGVPSSKPSPSPSPLQAVPASSCVVVSHIKADSPFAPLAHDDEQPRNDRDGLRPGDEILAVNGHRVGQDPGRAAAMIRAAPAGPLTLVASRGREGLGGDGAARHTAYHLPRQDDGGPPLGDGGLAFARSGSLVRVAAVARDGPFGSCPGLRPGDAVLAIGGRAVRSVAEARRRLAAPQPPARGDRAGWVVALLVYSFWDMRKRVLEKELELGGEARGDEGGAERRLPWQLSWSHEQPQPQLQQITREHVLLRLPETGVEFRLEFDEEGTCTCAEPAALRRNGDAAAESRRVAFERLYWQQVCPAIDALNHHAWQHVRGLTSALGIAPSVVAEHRDAASRRLPASAGRTAGAVAGEGESRQAARGVRGRGLPQHPSAKDAADASRWGGRRRSPLPNRAANGGQATFNDAEEENQGRKNSPRLKRPTGNVQANLKEEERRHANPARAISKEAEEEEVEEEEEEEELNNSSSFEKRLGKAQIFPTQGGERARRRSSGSTVEEEAEPDDMDVFEEQLGRLPAFSMQGIGEATTNVQNGPPNNHCEERPKQGRGWRSRPGRIPRKPSFVPMNLCEQSMMSALSANSSDESSDASTDVSSESGTSTTSSIGSSSSSSSESSGPVQGGRGKQASGQQPRGRAAAEAAGLSNSTELVVFKPKKEDRQKRRGKAANDAGGLANSTELVVFDPGSAREAGRDRAAGIAPGRRGDRCRRRPPLPLRLRMRAEDLRRRYRVLPAVLGRGTFGTVRSCVHRRTREEFAVKSIAKEGNAAKANTKLLENEIALVQRVKHPNVVSVADVYQDRTHIHIVMEKCEGGDLFGKIIEEETQLLEGRACEIVGSLLDAVAYLHDRNIVHRDLKVRAESARDSGVFPLSMMPSRIRSRRSSTPGRAPHAQARRHRLVSHQIDRFRSRHFASPEGPAHDGVRRVRVHDRA